MEKPYYEQEDYLQKVLLKVRSGLGRWKSPTGQWELLKEKQNVYEGDPYPFEIVTGPERSYKSIRRYGSTLFSMCSVIDGRREEGWILTEPQHPELQEFFRNGELITDATIIGDFFETVQTDKKVLSGLEAMLEAFS